LLHKYFIDISCINFVNPFVVYLFTGVKLQFMLLRLQGYLLIQTIWRKLGWGRWQFWADHWFGRFSLTSHIKFRSNDRFGAYKSYDFERAQWVKYSASCKFRSSIHRSEKVEIIWNLNDVLNPFIPTSCKNFNLCVNF